MGFKRPLVRIQSLGPNNGIVLWDYPVISYNGLVNQRPLVFQSRRCGRPGEAVAGRWFESSHCVGAPFARLRNADHLQCRHFFDCAAGLLLTPSKHASTGAPIEFLCDGLVNQRPLVFQSRRSTEWRFELTTRFQMRYNNINIMLLSRGDLFELSFLRLQV